MLSKESKRLPVPFLCWIRRPGLIVTRFPHSSLGLEIRGGSGGEAATGAVTHFPYYSDPGITHFTLRRK